MSNYTASLSASQLAPFEIQTSWQLYLIPFSDHPWTFGRGHDGIAPCQQPPTSTAIAAEILTILNHNHDQSAIVIK